MITENHYYYIPNQGKYLIRKNLFSFVMTLKESFDKIIIRLIYLRHMLNNHSEIENLCQKEGFFGGLRGGD